MKIIREEPDFLKPIPENFEIIPIADFLRDAKELNLTDSDIDELKNAVTQEPPEASLGSNAFKFRWVPKR